MPSKNGKAANSDSRMATHRRLLTMPIITCPHCHGDYALCDCGKAPPKGSTLCERCGGIRIEPAGAWTGKAYDSVGGGPCTTCDGKGYLSGKTKSGERKAWIQSLPLATDAFRQVKVNGGKKWVYLIDGKPYRMLSGSSHYGYGPEHPEPLSGGVVARVLLGNCGYFAREFVAVEETQ